jgi:hypothetical protein
VKEYYEPAELGFYGLSNKLYGIVNNIKHQDPKYYKRYKRFSKDEILEEASEFYRKVKTFFRKGIESFFLIKTIKYHTTS